MKRINTSTTKSNHKRSRTRQQEHAFLDASKYGLVPKKCVPCSESNSENKKEQRPSSNDVEGLKLNLDKDGKLVVTAKERKDLELFKTFLSFKTVSAEGPNNGEYVKAVSFLETVAKSLGLETKIYELVKNKPILLCSYQGTDPSLKSVLLNSHYDVVPAVNEMWHTDPFTPTEEANGDIYARGTQDMKCVSMQHLLAVGRLIASGKRPRRTIYLTFVPDEEIGGTEGLGTFVKTEDFKAMNVGCALDEGLARVDEKMTVFYGERCVWWCRVEARGKTGHGSRFVQNTAIPKLLRVLSKIQAFRAAEEAKLSSHGCSCGRQLGEVTSINITMLEAGVKTTVDEETGVQNYAFNVIPEVARAGFDTRVPPNVPLQKYKDLIDSWAEEEGVTWTWEQCCPVHAVTSIDAETSVWWRTFKSAVPHAEPEIFPAGTDSRYLRELGIPAFGFSPMNFTPVLLHDHDEFLNARVFLDGIEKFIGLIGSLADVKKDEIDNNIASKEEE